MKEDKNEIALQEDLKMKAFEAAKKKLATIAKKNGMDLDDLILMKQTIAKDLSISELKLFLHICKASELDPLRKQIYPVIFNANVASKRSMAIITSIDGYRSIANATGEYGGSEDYTFDDGLTQYEWLEKNKEDMKKSDKPWHPKTATCTVTRVVNGQVLKTTATAFWDSYEPKGDESKRKFWISMPFNQIGKCAEALALRKAFPSKLAEIYTDVEMEQAQSESEGVRGDVIDVDPSAPTPWIDKLLEYCDKNDIEIAPEEMPKTEFEAQQKWIEITRKDNE